MKVHRFRSCAWQRLCMWQWFVSVELWIAYFRLNGAAFHVCADQCLHLRLTLDMFF